jgi:hypothetical protein
MMRAAFWPLMIGAAGTWLAAIVMVLVLARMTVPPYLRYLFRLMAVAHSALVLAMFIWQAYQMSVGIIQPGWFYAWLYCGIFAPLGIALFFGAFDRGRLHGEFEERADAKRDRV